MSVINTHMRKYDYITYYERTLRKFWLTIQEILVDNKPIISWHLNDHISKINVTMNKCTEDPNMMLQTKEHIFQKNDALNHIQKHGNTQTDFFSYHKAKPKLM